MASDFRGSVFFDAASAREIRDALLSLERAVRKQVIEEALREGAEIIHDEAESRAPGPHIEVEIMTGRTAIKDFNLGREAESMIKANTKYALIGLDNDYWYYRFFEFGARPHDISVSSPRLIGFKNIVRAWAKNSGGTPKRPFLRPAVDNNREKVFDTMYKVVNEEIKKAAKK